MSPSHLFLIVDHPIFITSSTTVIRSLILPLLLQAADTTETAASLSPLRICGCAPGIGELGDGLREIDVDAMIVDEDALHFEIGLLAGGLELVFNECILERVVCALVADYFAREDFAETAKD
jgi:hypothetical protein